MAEKSPQAFRTIREVAEWLDIEAHVLRFWESKFSQIKPVKRAGGRRYYRPADMRLIGGIKVLLHDQGLTIRGAQKMIADDGVAAIAGLSPPLAEELEAETAATLTIDVSDDPAPRDAAGSNAGFFDIEALAGENAASGHEADAQTDAQTDAPAPAQDSAEPDRPEAEVAPQEAVAADAHLDRETPPPAPAEEPATADAPEDPAHDAPPKAPADTGPGEEAPPPPTPLSEIRVLLHEAVPLSPAQLAQLAPMVDRLEALAARLRTGHPG
ncbi:MAG: MerR family transcriptional regulator, partial [Rhodobacteraceae bacterium CG17_big_fil_post_rev_8_21_14_2_50_65_11]